MILQSELNMTWYPGAPLTLKLDPWKFGGHKFCENGDAKYLTYHVKSHDYIKKGSYDLMGENPSPLVTTLPSLLVIGSVKDKIERFKFVTCPHLTTWSRVTWLYMWESLTLTDHCVKFECL